MWWDTIKDHMNSFIGAFFLALSIFFIPEIKKSKKYWIPISVLIIFLVWLGIDKVNRDKHDKNENDKKLEALSKTLNNIQAAKTTDSINTVKNDIKDAVFQERLFKEFKIMRDSVNNRPVQKNYNTTIDKARDVYIGGRD